MTGMTCLHRAGRPWRDGKNFGCWWWRVVGCVSRFTEEFIFLAKTGRSGVCCPQLLWISLCKLAELMRYVSAGKEFVALGDIFEHVQNWHPHGIGCYFTELTYISRRSSRASIAPCLTCSNRPLGDFSTFKRKNSWESDISI